MKNLLVIDEKDYSEDMPIFEKYAVRGMIKGGEKEIHTLISQVLCI